MAEERLLVTPGASSSDEVRQQLLEGEVYLDFNSSTQTANKRPIRLTRR